MKRLIRAFLPARMSSQSEVPVSPAIQHFISGSSGTPSPFNQQNWHLGFADCNSLSALYPLGRLTTEDRCL